MGFRVRRSFKVAPGVRLNVSAKSIGVSAGVRGARISVNSSGRTTQSVGIPGTGISHVTTTSASSGLGRTSRASRGLLTPQKFKPGPFDPKWEKNLYRYFANPDDAVQRDLVWRTDPDTRNAQAVIELLRSSTPRVDPARTRGLLEQLVASEYDPMAESFLRHYMGEPLVTVPIATGVTAEVPLGRTALGLWLAELEQADGELDKAIRTVESLEPSSLAAVSLVELYADSGRWQDIVELTDGMTNSDEACTYLLGQRGAALRELGMVSAAHESFKEALRLRSRPPILRALVLMERGKTRLVEGKRSLARKDFEQVYAASSEFPGIGALLEQTS